MLTYCRKGVEPSLKELIQMFFIYKGDLDKNRPVLISNPARDKNYDRAIIPFAAFADEFATNKGIKVDFKLLLDNYNFSGSHED
ncbi:MAG: hypothetical protein ACTHM5_17100 [Ginsengibacter sp.]